MGNIKEAFLQFILFFLFFFLAPLFWWTKHIQPTFLIDNIFVLLYRYPFDFG